MSISRWIRRREPKLVPISPAVWRLSRLSNVWPKTPKGNLFGVYPFASVCQIWCQSVQPFDSFNRLLNLWPPKTPKMPPGILKGELYLAYVHSQTNPQTYTKFGANQSSCLTASPDFWICDPPKTPWDIEGRIVFSLCPFPDESADLYQICCQSVQPFDSFPKHLNLWTHKQNRNAPGVLWGELYLAYVHSQTNPPTCTKFGANRSSRLTASPDFWICDTLPPPPPKCPLGYWGATCI